MSYTFLCQLSNLQNENDGTDLYMWKYPSVTIMTTEKVDKFLAEYDIFVGEFTHLAKFSWKTHFKVSSGLYLMINELHLHPSFFKLQLNY